MDVLAHRTSLALLDNNEARKASWRVIDLMAEEMGWDSERRRKEQQMVADRLWEAL